MFMIKMSYRRFDWIREPGVVAKGCLHRIVDKTYSCCHQFWFRTRLEKTCHFL